MIDYAFLFNQNLCELANQISIIHKQTQIL